MRFVREALLSVIVIGVVVYLYFVAGGVLLFYVCGLSSSGGGPEAPDHLKIAAT
jgi:hypothetical protein